MLTASRSPRPGRADPGVGATQAVLGAPDGLLNLLQELERQPTRQRWKGPMPLGETACGRDL